MADYETGAEYEAAMEKLNKHITRNSDGTFQLDVTDGASVGVDEIVFADLKRSLDVTNDLIRRGVIDPNLIEDDPDVQRCNTRS